jgi:hypothetical protein
LNWGNSSSRASQSLFRGVNGYLATITSAAENQFVDGLSLRWFSIDVLGVLTGERAWIGANDQASEGTFVWAGGPEAGQNISGIYANWFAGEPNDAGGNEDCVVIYPRDDGRWEDNGCGGGRWSLIEYSCPSGQEFGPTACQSKC